MLPGVYRVDSAREARFQAAQKSRPGQHCGQPRNHVGSLHGSGPFATTVEACGR